MDQTDYGWVADALVDAVPWVKTAGITFVEVTAQRVVCALPDVQAQHNHVGGPHAAVIFGLGETASGALVLGTFSDTMARATPLAVRADIAYHKLARGDLSTEAILGRPAAEITAEFDAGKRPEFPVHCTIRDAEGVTTTEMTVVWTLVPSRHA